MSKIFSASQIKKWDAVTIQHKSISSNQLMEKAAIQCVEWIKNKFPDTDSGFAIFCGHGNNGGDGLAIARLLLESAYRVRVYLNEKASRSNDNLYMLRELENLHCQCIVDIQDSPKVSAECILIDAIFGTGLNREVDGIEREMIQIFNDYPNTKISIDIPSGLQTDSCHTEGAIIQADYTLSFQTYKLAFLFPESGSFCGKIELINIGLDTNFALEEPTSNYIIDKTFIADLYKKRIPFSHKGSYGNSLLIVGSHGKMGAAILASRACLRAGTGLLTVMIPEKENDIIQETVPEAMTVNFSNPVHLKDLNKFNSVGIGCGLGNDEISLSLLSQLIEEYKHPILLDADAINLMSQHHYIMPQLTPESILTPHPKEFDRLFGESKDSMERKQKQIEASTQFKIYILLKGNYTCISTPEGECYYNITGNAGMAKGGSGDSLSGIITALYAQYKNMKTAAILGAHLHGLAGDIASKKYAQESMLASDLIESLGDAFKLIQK